ncbi:MAG: hypothetical protein R3C20_05275 [Planctomycetaceae bacterium]
MGRLRKLYDDNRPAVLIATIPLTWAVVFFVWDAATYVASNLRVSEFIGEHTVWLAEIQARPGVHSVSMMRDNEMPDRVLIQFDVEDKATFLAVESEIHKLKRLSPGFRWDANVRSGEDIGFNAGAAVIAGGEALVRITERLIQLLVSGLLSILVFWLALRHSRRYPYITGDL